jgi:ribosomal protein S18 acetylase RimI-like enzyme
LFTTINWGYNTSKEHIYLIANIATHPDYRRKGIARALTERSMQHAHEKKVDNIWLHVHHISKTITLARFALPAQNLILQSKSG